MTNKAVQLVQLLRSSKRDKRLGTVILFVTSRCNAFCQTCFYHEELNQPGDLTFAQIEKVAHTMPAVTDLCKRVLAVRLAHEVTEKQLRADKKGDLFLQLLLRDRTGGISARFFNATEQRFRSFEEGDYLRVKGKVQLFQGSLQVVVSNFERTPPSAIALTDFLPRSSQDIGKLFERLRTLLRLNDPHLRALAECFLIDSAFVDAFCQVPASSSLPRMSAPVAIKLTVR